MITVVTCTYFSRAHRGEERMENARLSVQSWFRHLHYPELALHIADDGSDKALMERFQSYLAGLRVSYSSQARHGIGASLNKGLARAWESGLAFYLQDDLLLLDHVDLTFPAAVLEAAPDVMAVRVGFGHPDTTGRIRHFPGIHVRESLALELDPHHYVISFRPFLAHPRMAAQGPYLEDVAAEWCEKEYNERYLSRPVGRVVQWIPQPWVHQDVVNLGIIDPKGGV